MKNIVVSIVTVLVMSVLSTPVYATQVDLVCPCEIKENGQTGMILTAGLKNRDSSTSANLRLRIISHETLSNFDSPFFTLGYHYFTSTLAAGTSLANAEFKAGLNVPQNGSSFITMVLEEEQSPGQWTRIDSIRTRNQLTLNQSGGFAVSNADDEQHATVFFDGDPTASFSGSNVTIALTPIVNASPSHTTGNLTVDIVQANGDSIFGTSFSVAATNSLGVSLAPRTQTNATSITTNFSENSTAGLDFFHLRIVDGTSGQALAFRTVRVDNGTAIASRSFTQQNIEVLIDTDGDGVSNFNERLTGTDLNSASSVPADPVVDVLIYTSQNAAAATPNNDLQTRIDALLAATNQFYADSGAGVSFRFSTPVAVTIDESASLSSILTQMDEQQGVFSDIRQRKTDTGSDLALIYLPFPGGTLCGLATLTGKGLEGDFASVSSAHRANTAVFIDCRDNVTAHEIGHIFGLTHSRVETSRENDLRGGTFPWSVGHGVNNSFVTIMANTADFGGASELNRFSAPGQTCESVPCGVDSSDETNGADAVLSLRTTRFQMAAFTTATTETDTDSDGTPDSTDTDDDNDGTLDVDDAFPLDSNEQIDTDSDGTGNNADTDDDNDGTADTDDAFPLDATRSANARLVNLATRDTVGTGNEVMIGGLIIAGTEPKSVVVRARGQSLADADPNLQGLLQDPSLQIFSGATLIESNDNWEDHPRSADIRADLKPNRSEESAILLTLDPGAYTAIVRGVGETTGIGIVEIFEVADTGATRLNNIATRGLVGTENNVLIGGLIITGSTPKTVTIRARGPSLVDADPNLQGLLEDPSLELFSGATLIDSNDNWESHSSANDLRTDLRPSRANEAVITRTLEPGAYTAIVRGVNGTTGIGIVEVFEIN